MPIGEPDPTAEHAWFTRITDVVGPAFYLFNPTRMRRAIGDLREAFAAEVPRVDIHYAYKANFAPIVRRTAWDAGAGAEVDSPALWDLARGIGVPATRIIYNGVSREADSIHRALRAGAQVNVESWPEVEVVRALAPSPDVAHRVGVRVRTATPGYPNPRLGFGAEEIPEVMRALRATRGVTPVGFSAHVPDRSAEGVRHRVRTLADLSTAEFDSGPPVIDIGSIVGPMPSPGRAGEPGYTRGPAWRAAAAIVGEELARVPWGNDVVVQTEPGASLVADAVSLVATVADVRRQPGRVVANVAASIYHSSPNLRRADLPVRSIGPDGPREATSETVLIGGSTLVEGDWLSVDAGCAVHAGDFVVVSGVGAYSISMQQPFTGPALPVVVHEGPRWWVDEPS